MKKFKVLALLCAMVVTNTFAQDRCLENSNNQAVTLSQFRGKVVVVDFWFTGCINCMKLYRDVLSKVEENLKTDKKVMFVSVSIDRNKQRWQGALLTGKYTSNQSVNLFTCGLGNQCSTIKDYHIDFYPQIIVLDPKGNVTFKSSGDLTADDLRTCIQNAQE